MKIKKWASGWEEEEQLCKSFLLVSLDDITSTQSRLLSIATLFGLELILRLYRSLEARLGPAPSCVAEMLTPYEPARSLSSSGGALLAIPRSRLKVSDSKAIRVL